MGPGGAFSAVSDTAFQVARTRAIESERPDALFHDPYARMLLGVEGHQPVPGQRLTGIEVGVAVRTAVFDELILRTVRRDGAACVLNLGAGLDTRPYRLDLPADLRWVEADHPPIVAFKDQKLAGQRPRCRVERVAMDLADGVARRRLFEAVDDGPVLVVCEGVVLYLAPGDVAALAEDMAKRAPFRWWTLDLLGTAFIRLTCRTVGRRLSGLGSPMRFAPEDGLDFFARRGWEAIEARSAWDEARRLGRETWPMRAAWEITLPRWRAAYRDLARFVLLERRTPAAA